MARFWWPHREDCDEAHAGAKEPASAIHSGARWSEASRLSVGGDYVYDEQHVQYVEYLEHVEHFECGHLRRLGRRLVSA